MFCKFCKTGGILMTILYNRVGAKDRESMLQEKRCIRYGRQSSILNIRTMQPVRQRGALRQTIYHSSTEGQLLRKEKEKHGKMGKYS